MNTTDLRFLSIGSGSSGNCYYIGTGEYGFLIDAGVGIRSVKRGLKEHNISLDQIWGIFITHDHTDHICSVGVLGEKYHIPVYATKEVHEGINRNYRVTEKLYSCRKYFKKGEHLTIRDFVIQSFPVSHDASDNMGYSITYKGKTFVIATDLGYIGKEVADHIAKANYLVIEANYDETMLKNGPYPYPLKQRVRSYTGHLSNEHTARFLADNWHDKLTHIFLCHLSQENNTPEIAFNTVNDALAEKGITPELVHPLERMTLSELYIFSVED
jgi:phosphoribosyl 1,2-cyclic phosphodiesterase